MLTTLSFPFIKFYTQIDYSADIQLILEIFFIVQI